MRVLSYNLLADSYLKQDRYPHVSIKEFSWAKRKKAVFAQIGSYDADVICLQEVEDEAFADLNNHFSGGGYKGLFARKGLGKPDGCAIFFKVKSLPFAGAKTLFYNDGSVLEPPSGHIALIAYLQVKGDVVGVATTHIKPNFTDCPLEKHIGYRQVRELIYDHIHHNQKAQEWIICGDFNADDKSVVYELVKREGFHDAFISCPDPSYKNKRIDFLFHSSGISASPKPLPQCTDPKPNRQFPSDHFPICCDFHIGSSHKK